MKPDKICIDCHTTFTPPAHWKKSKGRCPDCLRIYNREAVAKLRNKKKAQMIIDVASCPPDRRVCSGCFELKRLSEFSPDKNKRSKELHKLCDACLTRLYTSKACVTDGFCPVWWRKRAYTMNTAYRNGKAKDKGAPLSSVQLSDLDFVVKPQELAAIYDQQGGRCSYCNALLLPESTSVDHAQPRSRGGEHRGANFRITCGDCNRLKYTRTEVEFREFVIEYAKRFQVAEHPDKESGG